MGAHPPVVTSRTRAERVTGSGGSDPENDVPLGREAYPFRRYDSSTVLAIFQTRSVLAGRGPKHRPEAHGLKNADSEEIGIEGAGDQGHHRDERVDDQYVLREEGQCEEEEREAEGSPRPCKDAPIYDEEHGGEDDV